MPKSTQEKRQVNRPGREDRGGSSSQDKRTDEPEVYAHGGDDGLKFLFPPQRLSGEPDHDVRVGGLRRQNDQPHLVALVGRGGTGKTTLALQLVTQILEDADSLYRKDGWEAGRSHAAFYFTLEATPYELSDQVQKFEWGDRFGKAPCERLDASRWEAGGLHLSRVPTPVDGLQSLTLHVTQTIARALPDVGRVVAILIDPLGGVDMGRGPDFGLIHLRQLVKVHRTFLFLVVEDHVFNRVDSIEHYSHTVIRLEHDPERQPYRRLHIQKCRNQEFRSGYHQLELLQKKGARIYPSVQAQSAQAHMGSGGADDSKRVSTPEVQTQEGYQEVAHWDYLKDQTIAPSSVAFLMGPPGTFKQVISTRFAVSSDSGDSLYISFKAEMGAVEAALDTVLPEDQKGEWSVSELKLLQDEDEEDKKEGRALRTIRFIDSRNPLMTPEMVLAAVRRTLDADRRKYRRAVVWGLRRLNDMPNFAGGKSVEFLEALVTLLKTRGATALLVDWPDQNANTLPIVDLSQYILLTRVCHSETEILPNASDKALKDVENLWAASRTEPDRTSGGAPDHIALMRVQRNKEGFHRDLGFAFERARGAVRLRPLSNFERYWRRVGREWERDPGLVN